MSSIPWITPEWEGRLPVDFLTASGATVPVEVRRRKGTRHWRLRLGTQNQIIASVPWHESMGGLAQFLEAQRPWLEAQLAVSPKACPLLEWLAAYPLLSASGDWFAVRIEAGGSARSRYTFDDGGSVVVLHLPDASEASLRALVRRFAKDALVCRVAYHAKRLNLVYGALTVRDQSSRWGSCSSSRGISLNWRLVLLQPALQDYIILHELAHLTEMSHSHRFWALLDSYVVGRRQHEAELDRISGTLMRVGRGDPGNPPPQLGRKP